MSNPEPPRPPVPPSEPTERLGAPVPPTQARVPRAPIAQPLPPAAPPSGPWWHDPWPAVLTGILALIVGGVLGYVIGRNGETASERSAREAPITRTVTNTATVPKLVVQTNTVTANSVTQTPAPANQANEERRTEAETSLRKAERENQELKKQLEEAGAHP